mmetsp:Transcript_89609/g.141442  ORF Transcript_89609/g.141442 Transcript_89609/m.141442 type:complete len:202 (-) Transcript_89609:24-629(-)
MMPTSGLLDPLILYSPFIFQEFRQSHILLSPIKLFRSAQIAIVSVMLRAMPMPTLKTWSFASVARIFSIIIACRVCPHKRTLLLPFEFARHSWPIHESVRWWRLSLLRFFWLAAVGISRLLNLWNLLWCLAYCGSFAAIDNTCLRDHDLGWVSSRSIVAVWYLGDNSALRCRRATGLSHLLRASLGKESLRPCFNRFWLNW